MQLKKEISNNLSSPAIPGFFILHGMLFILITVHFLDILWSSTATVIFYMAVSSWVILIITQQRNLFRSVTVVDWLFLFFIFYVLLRGATDLSSVDNFNKSYLRYLPFLTLIPYLCGRLITYADVEIFKNTVILASLILLILVLLDRIISPSLGSDVGRWPYFDLNHGPLLVGAVFSTSLLSLSVTAISLSNNHPSNRRLAVLIGMYVFIFIITVAFVWVTARGWLVAGLIGVVFISLIDKNHLVKNRIQLSLFVLSVALLSILTLPKIDPAFGKLYSYSFVTDGVFSVQPDKITNPELCKDMVNTNNSLSIRWMLYGEAVSMFMEYPIAGVGVARFRDFSCSGLSDYPHSTILQAFAELGLIGGGILLSIIFISCLLLIKQIFATADNQRIVAIFLSGLFLTFFITDQIYGNYLMSSGTWLIAGVVARMQLEKSMVPHYG